MGLKIEKRPSEGMESYFVLTIGEKKFEAAANAVKASLLIWTFCIVAIFTYIIGATVQLDNFKMTAYLLHGNLTDANGSSVYCNPVLTKDRSINWNCSVDMNGTSKPLK